MARRVQRDRPELAERLRREAEQSRPQFSEDLHTRIVQAIRRTEMVFEPIAIEHRRPARWAYAAVAAAVLIALWLGRWGVVTRSPDVVVTRSPDHVTPATEGLPRTGSGDPRTIVALESALNLTTLARDEWDGFVRAELTTERWAYLDHDFQTAAQALLDQLSFAVPADEQP